MLGGLGGGKRLMIGSTRSVSMRPHIVLRPKGGTSSSCVCERRLRAGRAAGKWGGEKCVCVEKCVGGGGGGGGAHSSHLTLDRPDVVLPAVLQRGGVAPLPWLKRRRWYSYAEPKPNSKVCLIDGLHLVAMARQRQRHTVSSLGGRVMLATRSVAGLGRRSLGCSSSSARLLLNTFVCQELECTLLRTLRWRAFALHDRSL